MVARLELRRTTLILGHPWRDGSTHVLFEPLELVAKLAALVPPPRFNLVRYHGVLAPAARSRPEIVPPSPPRQAETSPHSGCRAHGRTGGDSSRPQSGKSNPRERPTRQGRSGWGQRPRNYSWAELMHRVWAIDVLECPRCLGRMRILAAIHPPDAIRAILECLGLPSRAPPIASAAGRSSSHPDEPV